MNYDLDRLAAMLARSKDAGTLEQDPFFWAGFIGFFEVAAPNMISDLRLMREHLDTANLYIDQYRLEVEAMRAMLTKHQWSATIEHPDAPIPVCPECGQEKYEGHAGGCELAALLGVS